MLLGGSLLNELEDVVLEPPSKIARVDTHRLGGAQPNLPSKGQAMKSKAEELQQMFSETSDEIQDTSRLKVLTSSKAVELRRIHAEWVKMRRELTRLEQECCCIGVKSADPEEVEAATHLPPLPEGNALVAQPLFICGDGFEDKRLNVVYRRNGEIPIGGHPTYWSTDNNAFLFFSQAGSGRWQATIVDENSGHSTLEKVQNTPADEHPPSIAYQVEGSLWSEFVTVDGSGNWREIHLDFSKSVEADFMQLSGFTDRNLDGMYRRSNEQVSGMSTYFSKDGEYFLYIERVAGRWQLAPRRSQGRDLLAAVRSGESPGLGQEVDGHVWREYIASTGEWEEVMIEFLEVTAKKAGAAAFKELPSADSSSPPPPAVVPAPAKLPPTPALADKPGSGPVAPTLPTTGAWKPSAAADLTGDSTFGGAVHVAAPAEGTSVVNQAAAPEDETLRDEQDKEKQEKEKVRLQQEKDFLPWKRDLKMEQDETKRAELTALFARLPDVDAVPKFDDKAHGTPMEWNVKVMPWAWNKKKIKWYFDMPKVATVDIRKFKKFLALRQSRDGRQLIDLLGEPEPMGDGAFRCAWKDFPGDANMPEETTGDWEGKADWQRAWHGCKLEALYSIMFHGRLRASNSASGGDRFWKEAPGVYCHKDGTKDKAQSYVRWVPLCRDGVFWSTYWELRVDRTDRVGMAKFKTDQWVQREGSVRLAALWVQGCTYEDMQGGYEVQEVWDPLLEANPFEAFERPDLPASTADSSPTAAAAPADVGSRAPHEAEFRVDNGELQTEAPGIRFRTTKQNTDVNTDKEPIPWGQTLRGIDEGDGWLRVGSLYLPMQVDAKRVLFEVQTMTPSGDPTAQQATKAQERFEAAPNVHTAPLAAAPEVAVARADPLRDAIAG